PCVRTRIKTREVSAIEAAAEVNREERSLLLAAGRSPASRPTGTGSHNPPTTLFTRTTWTSKPFSNGGEETGDGGRRHLSVVVARWQTPSKDTLEGTL